MSKNPVNRRNFLQALGVSAAATSVACDEAGLDPNTGRPWADKRRNRGGEPDGADGTPFRVPKFVQPMPLPPVKEPIAVGEAPFEVGEVFHGVAPEWFDRTVAELPGVPYYEALPTQYYSMSIAHTKHEIIPGVETPMYGYDGMIPGPTFRMRVGEPALVRVKNELRGVEQSVHLHGGHNPAHSDGYPNFYVLPGMERDYYWTNTVPMHNRRPDFTESPSTCWYHDHAMDITAHNVLYGLAGFAIVTDELEEKLIDDNVLPREEYDIPVVLQDKQFNSDGTIYFDPLDHNGYLGDVYVVNGKAYPYFEVERRKYRFRFLNGANARFMELRLSDGSKFMRIGKDSWLYPQPIEEATILLAMANRADVIIDFTDAPDELYLENILEQDDGRGPRGKIDDRRTDQRDRMLKFIVRGERKRDSATITMDTPLRPHLPIRESEAVRTRHFKFERRRGAWQINHEFFDENKANAVPELGTVERWVFENSSGGWWHPVHIHLESHQQILLDDGPVPLADRWKSDTVTLGAGSTVEFLMNFRTFRGPFVFHCHNLEHEDMRMMFVFDPRTGEIRDNTRIQARYP